MKITLLHQNIKWLLLFGLSLLLSLNKINAQAPTVTYEVANNLTAGYNKSALQIKIVFNGNCTGTQLRIGFPTGVTYANGLSKVSGTAALNVAYNATLSTPQSPVIDITGAVSTGNEIVITLDRQAHCQSIQGGSFDSVFVTGSCTAVSKTDPSDPDVINYNIYRPTTPITPAPALVNATVGQTASRTTTVTVGGANSLIDTFRFFIVYPNGAISNTTSNNAIVANGTSFAPCCY